MRIPKTDYKTTERQREYQRERKRINPEYQKDYYRRHRAEINEKARLKRLESPEWQSVLRKNRYGLVKRRFDTMYMTQCGKCAICTNVLDQEAGDRNTSAHVDHSHNTGSVRGLLCGPCNRGLGLFRDYPEALRGAAEYIEES